MELIDQEETSGPQGIRNTDGQTLHPYQTMNTHLHEKEEYAFFYDWVNACLENYYHTYRLNTEGLRINLSWANISPKINKKVKVISEKINQGKYYTQLLGGLNKYIQLPPVSFDDIQNHYWVYGLVINQDGIRSRVVAQLEENGIQTRPFFWPLHLQPAYLLKYSSDNVSLPNAEKLGNDGLYLPMGAHIKKNTQKFIVNSLKSSLKEIKLSA